MELVSGGPVFPAVWLTTSPRWWSVFFESRRTRSSSSMSVYRGFRAESSREIIKGEATARGAAHVV
jgi:hypothetical protein